MNEDSFILSLLNDRVKLPPKYLHKDLHANNDNIITSLLSRKIEGKCSKHGYIKKSSISILKISVGRVEAHSLRGYVNFDVQFSALVCNPTNGSRLNCKVINSNNFGILCSSGLTQNGTYIPILDIFVPKNSLNIKSDDDVDLNEISKNQEVVVEIVGKKFEINDKMISAVGRIISNASQEVNIDKDDDDNLIDLTAMDDDLEDDVFMDGGDSLTDRYQEPSDRGKGGAKHKKKYDEDYEDDEDEDDEADADEDKVSSDEEDDVASAIQENEDDEADEDDDDDDDDDEDSFDDDELEDDLKPTK